MERRKSQNDRILGYLQEGNTITPLEALDLFGCFRLSARIHDLKKRECIGVKTIKHNGKCFSGYYLRRDYE